MFEVGGKVRVVMKRPFKEGPGVIFRGIVVAESVAGLHIRGREFAQQMSNVTARSEEKPVDQNEKDFFIPFDSMAYTEMILKGSREDKLDEMIQKEETVKRKGRMML